MAATGVGPKTCAVVLARGASLQEQSALVVEEEHAERAMQRALLMRAQFAHGADRFIALVHKHHLFLR
jgi:endonuclease III